ncbi:hypothetical protein P885DRAFT_59977 [Corynascus similis CBS 632.67]
MTRLRCDGAAVGDGYGGRASILRAVRESSMDSRDKGGWGAWFEGDHRQEKQRYLTAWAAVTTRWHRNLLMSYFQSTPRRFWARAGSSSDSGAKVLYVQTGGATLDYRIVQTAESGKLSHPRTHILSFPSLQRALGRGSWKIDGTFMSAGGRQERNQRGSKLLGTHVTLSPTFPILTPKANPDSSIWSNPPSGAHKVAQSLGFSISVIARQGGQLPLRACGAIAHNRHDAWHQLSRLGSPVESANDGNLARTTPSRQSNPQQTECRLIQRRGYGMGLAPTRNSNDTSERRKPMTASPLTNGANSITELGGASTCSLPFGSQPGTRFNDPDPLSSSRFAKKIVVYGVVCILLAFVSIRDFLDGGSKSSGDEPAWHRRKPLQHLLLPILAPIRLQYAGSLFYRQYFDVAKYHFVHPQRRRGKRDGAGPQGKDEKGAVYHNLPHGKLDGRGRCVRAPLQHLQVAGASV